MLFVVYIDVYRTYTSVCVTACNIYILCVHTFVVHFNCGMHACLLVGCYACMHLKQGDANLLD